MWTSESILAAQTSPHCRNWALQSQPAVCSLAGWRPSSQTTGLSTISITNIFLLSIACCFVADLLIFNGCPGVQQPTQRAPHRHLADRSSENQTRRRQPRTQEAVRAGSAPGDGVVRPTTRSTPRYHRHDAKNHRRAAPQSCVTRFRGELSADAVQRRSPTRRNSVADGTVARTGALSFEGSLECTSTAFA